MKSKLPVLLKINTMMKRRAEQRFLEISNARRDISRKITEIEKSVILQKEALFISESEAVPLDCQTYERWKHARFRQVQELNQQDKALMEQQLPVRDELAALHVREKSFEKRLRVEKQNNEAVKEQVSYEQVQSIWIQNNV